MSAMLNSNSKSERARSPRMIASAFLSAASNAKAVSSMAANAQAFQNLAQSQVLAQASSGSQPRHPGANHQHTRRRNGARLFADCRVQSPTRDFLECRSRRLVERGDDAGNIVSRRQRLLMIGA